RGPRARARRAARLARDGDRQGLHADSPGVARRSSEAVHQRPVRAVLSGFEGLRAASRRVRAATGHRRPGATRTLAVAGHKSQVMPLVRVRKSSLYFALAICAWVLAPSVRAGGGEPALGFTEQWRVLPHAPVRRAADEAITARLTRQIDPLIALFQSDGSGESPATLGDRLIDGTARIQLFRLESLLRLYGR